MEIDLPTTKPIVLTPGEENMLIPESEGDFIITLTSDRGTPTATFTEDDTPKAKALPCLIESSNSILKHRQSLS